jgi:hypothetical protein
MVENPPSLHEARYVFTRYCTTKVKLIEWLFIPGADALTLTVYVTPVAVPATVFENVPPPPPPELPPLGPEPEDVGPPPPEPKDFAEPLPLAPPHAQRPDSAIRISEPKTRAKRRWFVKTARIIRKTMQMPTGASFLATELKGCVPKTINAPELIGAVVLITSCVLPLPVIEAGLKLQVLRLPGGATTHEDGVKASVPVSKGDPQRNALSAYTDCSCCTPSLRHLRRQRLDMDNCRSVLVS